MEHPSRWWRSRRFSSVCPSSFNLTKPSIFHPYCYRMHQRESLLTQEQAAEQCRKQQTQLVWFQSMDELQEQLMPALITHGYTRGSLWSSIINATVPSALLLLDFWTSGMRNSTSNRWQWYLSNNNSYIDMDPSIISQAGSGLLDQSLYVSFDPSTNRRLMTSPSTNQYATICKIPATRLSLNAQTRNIDLMSQQTAFINQWVSWSPSHLRHSTLHFQNPSDDLQFQLHHLPNGLIDQTDSTTDRESIRQHVWCHRQSDRFGQTLRDWYLWSLSGDHGWFRRIADANHWLLLFKPPNVHHHPP